MAEQNVVSSTSVPNKQPEPIEGERGIKMPPGKGRYTIGGKGTHGCKGYPVVGGEGAVHGCHPTRAAAIQQQAAIYASQAQQAKKFLNGEADSLDIEVDVIDIEKSMHESSNDDCPCAGEPECECDDMESDNDMVGKADYNTRQRREMARRGQAMNDGSFPIANETDLSNAIQSVGRAANYDAARRHIISRARALGRIDMLPEDWNVKKSLDGIFKSMPTHAKRVNTTGNAEANFNFKK